MVVFVGGTVYIANRVDPHRSAAVLNVNLSGTFIPILAPMLPVTVISDAWPI